MIDPRVAVVERRLAGVRSILAVASGKGGVGKSACAVAGALALARRGLSVGLLDLDFQGASCHTLLGCAPGLPAEDRGLLPLEPVACLRFATIASYTAERPAAMRGADLSSALRELLAVIRWGDLDVLLVDMPPGIHDPALELAVLVPRCRTLVVTTRSRVAAAVTARLVRFLVEAGSNIAGLVENMADQTRGTDAARGPSPAGGSSSAREGDSALVHLAQREGIDFLGALPADPSVEAAVGKPDLLAATALARALEPILMRVLGREG